MTIHITPEPSFSYVSFESNVSASNYGELISRVIETFQPGKFVVTVFANKVNSYQRFLQHFNYNDTSCFRHLRRLLPLVSWTTLRPSANGSARTSSTVVFQRTILPTRTTASSRAEGYRLRPYQWGLTIFHLPQPLRPHKHSFPDQATSQTAFLYHI